MNGESPERAKLAEASPILYSASSTVVTEPPIPLAASASQRVEYPLDVPISSTRRAAVARTSTARNSPVSRVMLSMRRGRSFVAASFASPKHSSSAFNVSSTSLTSGFTNVPAHPSQVDEVDFPAPRKVGRWD